MAPEILVSEGPGYREKADIFSAGSILFNLLTKHYLFDGKGEVS